LSGDRIQLQQVILNLVSNSIDAMAAVTPRNLVIRSILDGADRVRIDVEDSGCGIDAEDAERVFDAFFTTKPSGMGMGLSVCRSIIENHGGRLWASRNSDRGTTFHFTLPVRQTVES
jgi:signal transduction histidine kinase